MTISQSSREAVLRVGEVIAVEGRRIYVLVDRNKNVSHMFLDGDILTNIAVNSYLCIRKGFLSIIGRVEGEKIDEDFRGSQSPLREAMDRNRRVLTIALTGYIDERAQFTGGTRELPLIGNEAFLLSREQLFRVHDLVGDRGLAITIGTLYGDNIPLRLPVDGLFNSHIAIFGNTGSGKSNTLALLYQQLVTALRTRNNDAYKANARFLLFDFNGEYTQASCISVDKRVYNLSTRTLDGDKLPLSADALLDLEVLSILADATDKTQKPFLARALRTLDRIRTAANPTNYWRTILRDAAAGVLKMSDKLRAETIMEHFRSILPEVESDGQLVDIASDLDWLNNTNQYLLKTAVPGGGRFPQTEAAAIPDTRLYQRIASVEFGDDWVANIIRALHLQIISDILNNRAQNEHVAPMILRLVRRRPELERIFDFSNQGEFWSSNFVVVNLHGVNLDIRKTLPLLLSKRAYSEHRHEGQDKTLTLIIDEAHNILSTESFRETESWKDYRLETFEEIIKEGRKFGVFVTIASQRPNDISPTITSQAHNYFIHRLINDADLKTISTAVSYIDRVTQESIPTLPTGTCIFSGVASGMPIKMNVQALAAHQKPESNTRAFSEVVPLPNQEAN